LVRIQPPLLKIRGWRLACSAYQKQAFIDPKPERLNMDKLKQLLSLCKCGVYISVNKHRDYYESVEKHLTDLDSCSIDGRTDEVDPEVRQKMIETDTIIHIQFYPSSPVGFYDVFHWDMESALDEALECLKP
jgi:hypothetical protein